MVQFLHSNFTFKHIERFRYQLSLENKSNDFYFIGDMKSFLIKYERDILHDNEKYCGQINMSSRLLIQLSYDIAKGMKYLSRKHIMHGDLAARNILIGGKCFENNFQVCFI